MILPNFILYQSASTVAQYSGLDSPEYCHDPEHFKNYPYKVEYRYNSRGYRDQEWPDTKEELNSCVWCFGDSFTSGLGSPVEHTWPYMLSKEINKRTINVSMDGASNNWIARKINDLFTELQPKTLVIHWSYFHRREMDVSKSPQYVDNYYDKQWEAFYAAIRDQSWPDCKHRKDFFSLPQFIQDEIVSKRFNDTVKMLLETEKNSVNVIHDEKLRLFSSDDPKIGTVEDLQNTINCIESVESAKPEGTQIIHSFIPNFAELEKKHATQQKLYQYLQDSKLDYTPVIKNLDWARDHHHYGKVTAESFVEQVKKLLR